MRRKPSPYGPRTLPSVRAEVTAKALVLVEADGQRTFWSLGACSFLHIVPMANGVHYVEMQCAARVLVTQLSAETARQLAEAAFGYQ